MPKRDRPNTRAYSKEMEEDSEIIDESTNAISNEPEEYTTEDEEIINEDDEQSEVENNELRSEILKILKSQKSDENLIAKLQDVIKNNGAAKEKHITNKKTKDPKTVSAEFVDKNTTKRENSDPARNFEWRPSSLQLTPIMDEAEPIRKPDSKCLARKTLHDMKNEKEKSHTSEESETENEEDSINLQIESAMKTLFAAFGPKLKISRKSPEKQASKPANRRLPDTTQNSRTATPEPRETCRFYPTPKSEASDIIRERKRETIAASKTPKTEPETESSEEEPNDRTTMERTFYDEATSKMRTAHARKLEDSPGRFEFLEEPHRLVADIPTPFCNFRHLQDHGLPQVVSNGQNNIGNLPSDFPKLKVDGNNLQEWYQQLQVIFMKENLLFFITNPPRRPWALKIDNLHHRAFFIIIASISPAMYYSIKSNLTVSEIIQYMFNLFHSNSVATTTRMSKDFFSSRVKPGVSISEHLIYLNRVRAELQLRGEVISDQTMKSVIINSLDSSWDNFMSHLDTINLGYLSIENLSNKLITEDNYRKSRSNNHTEHRTLRKVAFQDRHNESYRCHNCGSREHNRRDCPRFSRERRRPEYTNRYNYRQSSVDRHRYRSPPNHRENRGGRENSRDRKSGSLNGLNRHDNTKTMRNDNNNWLIDSGATNHTTNNKSILSSFTEDKFIIKVANQEKVQVLGKGNVTLPGLGEIEGVLLVPKIPHNILSALKLSRESNINITFSKGEAILEKNKCNIGTVMIKGGLPYFIAKEEWLHNVDSNVEECIETDDENVSNSDNDDCKITHDHNDTHNLKKPKIGKPIHDECAHILHRKLGHASFPVVQKMTEHAEGIKIKNCENYLECSVCKSTKLKTSSKPKKSTRTTNKVFDLVHMDLVGPLTPSITYKKRYFLTIVDDYSRYGFVYTLKHKNETFQKFKEFYKRIETQHNIKIKQIMTDRGCEFMSQEFSQWLKDRGMLHYTSSPFSAFQNGIAERKNSTLQTMIRCTLEDAGLGKHFWSEALHYSNYTQNRTWSSIINKTPYEVMYNRKPKLAHMHIFGVTADVHIPKQLRRKGENVSRRLKFMGYETGTKGYRFIDSNNKFIVSRSAVFHEQANWSKLHLNEIFPNKHLETKHHKERTVNIQNTNKHKNKTKTWTNSQHKIKIDTLTKKEARYMHDNNSKPERTFRSNRNKMPNKYKDYIMNMNNEQTTPNTYDEVLKLPQEEKEKWELAMKKEMESLQGLNVFTPITAPKDKTIIGTRWIYKIKNLEGGNSLYKARLVAQGYAQKYPEDYTDTYSPTVRTESVKTALVVASALNLDVFQYDIQTAYLHAKLDKEIYVRAPHSQYTNRNETWLLNKSLYGLKQSGKRWYDCLVKVLNTMGFNATSADNCFFIKRSNDCIEFVLIYVDDILYIGKHKEKREMFVNKLNEHFSLKSLGKVNKYLGVQISKTKKGFQLTQKDKILELLNKCNLMDAKPCDTPMQTDFLRNTNEPSLEFKDNTFYRSIIGSLLYISNWTRPDITLPLNLLSRYVSKPTIYHWEAIKRILKYLKGTIDFCLVLEPNCNKEPRLVCYADADWAGDTSCRKSTSGYIFFLNNCPIYWYTGKQELVATSTTEAEYICLSKAANNLVWFNDLISEIWKKPALPFIMNEDNKAAIEISRSDAIGQRSRHIDIKFKHVRQLSHDGFIKAVHCDTSEQIADILTKPLPGKQHKYLTSKLHVMYSPEQECNWCHTTNRHLEGDLLDINASFPTL